MIETARAPHGVAIELWRPDDACDRLERDLHELAEMLRLAVHEGAGVSFFVPFALDEAIAFWRHDVLPGVRAGTRRVLVARDGPRIVGTVQIHLALPPNQRHRAEVAKMLVHPDVRRRGVGRALMAAVERVARADGRTLLTLDTVAGSGAERLYGSLGWVTVGVIPRFARKSLSEELKGATIMYKDL